MKAKELTENYQTSADLALEGSDLGMWDWNIKTNSIKINNKWAQMLGYEIQEIGENLADWESLVHPKDLKKVKNSLKNFLNGRLKEYSSNFRMLHKNGNWIWVLSKGKIFEYDLNGKPSRAVGTSSDITQQKTFQYQLEESEIRFRNAMKYSPVGIALVSKHGRWLEVNQSLCNILGYKSEELLEIDFLRITHHDDIEEDLIYVNQLLNGDIDSYKMEKRFFHKNGSIVWVLLSVSLVPKAINHSAYFLSQIVDITNKKEYEANLKKVYEEMESFTYIASHDLRAPLVNLKGYSMQINNCIEKVNNIIGNNSEVICKEDSDILSKIFNKQIPDSIKFITASIDKMDDMTQAILELSRTGCKKLVFAEIDINEIVDKIFKVLSHQLQNKNAEIIFGKLPNIIADYTSIEQIFNNLISNSVKYLSDERNGKIEIFYDSECSYHKFTVKDNGIGIDDRDFDKVFDVFRRARNVTDIEGQGMGLNYAKKLVERHGGDIKFESRLDYGTEFVFSIAKNISRF